MKKLFSLLLVVLLVATCSVSVLANNAQTNVIGYSADRVVPVDLTDVWCIADYYDSYVSYHSFLSNSILNGFSSNSAHGNLADEDGFLKAVSILCGIVEIGVDQQYRRFIQGQKRRIAAGRSMRADGA